MATLTDQVFIQHRFTITLADGTTFSDAIVLPRTEYNALSAADINKLKQDRLAAWRQAVRDASNTVSPRPSREELQARRRQLADDLQLVDQEIVQAG